MTSRGTDEPAGRSLLKVEDERLVKARRWGPYGLRSVDSWHIAELSTRFIDAPHLCEIFEPILHGKKCRNIMDHYSPGNFNEIFIHTRHGKTSPSSSLSLARVHSRNLRVTDHIDPIDLGRARIFVAQSGLFVHTLSRYLAAARLEVSRRHHPTRSSARAPLHHGRCSTISDSPTASSETETRTTVRRMTGGPGP